MKKLIALLLVLVMVMSMAACGVKKNDNDGTKATDNAKPEETKAEENKPTVTGMTYAEYVEAEMDADVTVVTYVQATQSWWDNKISVYCQSEDGAYFAYNMTCTQEDAAKLVPGTQIKITGSKGDFSGEIEIVDGTFEFVEGGNTYIADVMDATALLGTDDLIKNQNKKVAFKDMTIVASKDKNGKESAFLYSWDGSGSADSDSDLYFSASVGDKTYSFCVEYYLCGPDSDAYKAVQALKIGDKVDMEGFLYWYEGPQPHITAVTVK